ADGRTAVLAPTSPADATPQTTFPVSKFSGDPDQCRGFLLQCSVFFDNSPVATDQAKISFVVSRLTGKALDWATASWSSFSNWTYALYTQRGWSPNLFYYRCGCAFTIMILSFQD
uniref:DUF4939 domain-containing protein n=1 Tax=Pygocentrus nattereri TaxID=42514 RepID=A0AAR2JHZ5_PYGNA